MGPDRDGAFDGTDETQDPDDVAWGIVNDATSVAREVPGITKPTADRIERIYDSTRTTSGTVPPSRARWWRRRVRRWSRGVGLVLLAVLAGSGALGIADRLSDPYDPPPRTQNWRPVEDPQLALAKARDRAGATDWGMRILSRAGHRCATLGRLHRGRIGTRSAGRFVEFVAGASRACPRPGESTMVRWKDFGPTTGRRSIAYGIAARGATVRIAQEPPSSRIRSLADGTRLLIGDPPAVRPEAIADDGSFIHMAVGVNSLKGMAAYVTEGAHVRVVPLGMP